MRLMSLACTIAMVAMPVSLFAADEKVELKEFESKEGKFKVMLPGKPTETKQKIKTAIGEMEIVLFVCEIGKDLACVVSYNDYPDVIKQAPAATVLDGAMKGVIGKGKSVKSTEIKYKKTEIEGREFEYTKDETATGHARVYLHGARMYQMLVLGNNDKLKNFDVKKFLDSLEFETK